ncbi:hypothetical protein Sjap_005283 [Stephania japonica]|uniref:Amine oxidase domain-containing protein n=1 Tax=Stephania japonica TaxID=461633 RepID=A0AAP0K669_9MAGN
MENAYPGSNILVVTLTNEESKRVEAQSEKETLREAIDMLRDIFGLEVHTAERILVPPWWNNHFQRGSCSNYPIFATHQDFVHIKNVATLTILVIGKGGVGKSSTVNSLIRERVVNVSAFQERSRRGERGFAESLLALPSARTGSNNLPLLMIINNVNLTSIKHNTSSKRENCSGILKANHLIVEPSPYSTVDMHSVKHENDDPR